MKNVLVLLMILVDSLSTKVTSTLMKSKTRLMVSTQSEYCIFLVYVTKIPDNRGVLSIPGFVNML